MSVLADLPRRTKIVALLGLSGFLIGAAALAVGPILRARALAAAERRGLELEIGQVRLGWAGVWLKDVQFRVPRMPGVRGHLSAVRIGVSFRFSVTELALHGASIELNGESDALQQQWAAYRSALAQDSTEHSGGSARYRLDGVDVVWRRRAGEAAQRVWGLRYERDGAQEDVSLELARFQADGMQIDAHR